VAFDEPAVAFEVPPELTDSEVQHALGEDLALIQQLSQLRGLDAYGWYTTFHQKRYQWGIHIPIEGILAFALHAFAEVDLPVERKISLAYHAILRHELFHFNVDCMAANWELTTGAAVFWNAQEKYRNADGYMELEEALANAYMLRGFKHPPRALGNAAGAYKAAKAFCERQPAGYRDAMQYLKTRGSYGGLDSYFDACSELSVAYQHSSTPLWSPLEQALDALIFYPDLIRIDWTRCPIFILDEHDLRGTLGIGVSYFHAICNIEETANFSRALRKLDRSIRKRWQTSVDKLAVSTTLSGLGFKPWKPVGPDWYSVNVGGNYRAHLRYDRSESRWFAEEIGNHKEMGHG